MLGMSSEPKRGGKAARIRKLRAKIAKAEKKAAQDSELKKLETQWRNLQKRKR